MRGVARALGALAVGIVILLGALALWLPRWLVSDGARERLLAEAREATGRDVAAGALSFSFFPPRLVASDVRVGDAAAPLVAAERVDLRLDPAPLLSRDIVVESLALDGVTWRVPRGANGLDLPWKSGATAPAAAESAAESAGREGSSEGLRLDVARITLDHSQLVFEDARSSPPARIELRDVSGEALAGKGAPLSLGLSGTLTSGGTLRLARDPAKPGAPDLEVTLESVDLAAFAPYLGKDLALAGKVTGTLAARGPAAKLDALDASLEIADAEVRAGDVVTKGPVGVTAKLSGALEALVGSFEIDATRATLDAYGGAFQKKPGAPAKATGKLVRDAQGRLGVDGVRVKIENMGGAATIGVDGTFFADADRFRSEGLVATLGGQPVAIAIDSQGQTIRTRATTKAADAKALFAALGRPDLLEGALDLDASLAGATGSSFLASLAGAIDVAVGPGRIPSVSPLGETIGLLDRYPEVGRTLNRKKTERRLAPYLGDRFESITGHFDVAGGRARTEGLVLRYPGYELALRGSVGLADQALYAKGRLTLDPALEAALADDPGRAPKGAPRVIEIAAVEGTLAKPKLRIDEAGAIAFAATLTLAQKRDKWERKLDQALGEGKGGDLLDALDGFLGKKERQ